MKFFNNLKFGLFLFISLFIMVSCGSFNKETVDNKNMTIISLSPSNTEILVGLSLGENIIALDDYSNRVEGTNKNAQVFKFGEVSIEKLIELNPSLVVISGFTFDEFKLNQLKEYGIKVLSIDTATTIEEIYDSILLIGKETGKIKESENLVSNLKSKVSNIENNNNKNKNIRVYFEISPSPYLYSFGKNTYLDEMIEISGGKNIYHNLNGWISPNEEDILKLNPEIIFTNVNTPNNIEEIKNRPGWNNIDAVKNNQIYYIDEDNSSRPSQFFIKALEDMSLHIREFKHEK